SLLTPPDDEEVLKNFYLKVRPWGFWKPVYEKVAAEYPGLEANRDFGRDMFNVAVGIAWQTSITAAGIFLVIEEFTALLACVAVIAVTSVVLKRTWYDRLKDYPDLPAAVAEPPAQARPVTG